MLLDLDQRVGSHHLAHGLVGRQITLLVQCAILGISSRVHGTEQEAGMKDERGAANLTESERSLKEDEVQQWSPIVCSDHIPSVLLEFRLCRSSWKDTSDIRIGGGPSRRCYEGCQYDSAM